MMIDRVPQTGDKMFTFNQQGADNVPVDVVGNKAYNLMRLSEAGLPVPAGFVLSTELCHEYFAHEGRRPAELADLLIAGVRSIESATGLSFGGNVRPLFVSVRSGAAASMPGMLETLLNVGLSDATLQGAIRMTGNPRFVWDSYRRLIQGYAEVVYGSSGRAFQDVLGQGVGARGYPVRQRAGHCRAAGVDAGIPGRVSAGDRHAVSARAHGPVVGRRPRPSCGPGTVPRLPGTVPCTS